MAAGTLEAWAKRAIVVPDGPFKGQPYRIRREPWREVLASLASPQLEQVTIRASVQSGKTAAVIVAALYHLAHGRSVLFYEPSEKLQRHMAKRIIQWGRAAADEGISRPYASPRPPFVREHGSGGRLEVLNAAEATSGLSRTAEIVIVDELRAFQADVLQEIGDRMAAFGGRGKLITASSAGYEHECKTTAEFEKSDARQWFMACPKCGRATVAAWEAFRYKNRARAAYVMPCCAVELDTRGLAGAVAQGAWRRTAHARVPRTRGYHLDAFSGSAFETLETIRRAWLRASEHRKQTGSMAEIIAFQTGRLARPYNPQLENGVTPDAIRTHCRENYNAGVIPAEAALVTVAVDTQDNRLEAEVSAWGAVEVAEESATELKGWSAPEFKGLTWRGKWYRLKRWALSYHRIYGDPGTTGPWEQLQALCETRIPHALGPLVLPAAVGIDTGGHHAADVANFVIEAGPGYQCLRGLPTHRHDGTMARWSATEDSLAVYGPAGLLIVNGNAAKSSAFSMIRAQIGGAEAQLLWPVDETHYGPMEYEGICSEVLTRTINRRTGQTNTLWRKVRRENEALDLLVYALAMVAHLGVGHLLNEAEKIRRAAERNAA